MFHADSTFLETDAVCLRIVPFSQTSHIVSWLTPGHGLLRTVVKGACRPKSWFLGQYDLFQTCELIVYARSRNGLHILKECCATLPRSGFRTDWRSAAVASYLCDLVTRNLFGSAVLPECFALLARTLDTLLVRPEERLPLTFWFELQFAHALGLSPALLRCSACNRPIPPLPMYTFSAAQGGLVCLACRADDPVGTLRIAPDAIAIVRRWQRAASPHVVVTTRCSSEQLLAISRLLGTFLAYHLEIKPAGRHAALELSTLKDPSCLTNRTA